MTATGRGRATGSALRMRGLLAMHGRSVYRACLALWRMRIGGRVVEGARLESV